MDAGRKITVEISRDLLEKAQRACRTGITQLALGGNLVQQSLGKIDGIGGRREITDK